MLTKSGRYIYMKERLFFFDDDTSAMTIIKLCAYMCNKAMRYNIFNHLYEFINKDDKKRYILTDLTIGCVKSTNSTIIKKVKERTVNDGWSIKLKYNDYFLALRPCLGLGYLGVGRFCDENMVFFKNYGTCLKNYNMLRSITNIMYNDRFKDNGFDSFINDCKHAICYEKEDSSYRTTFLYNKYFKSFFAPNIRRPFNYNPNVKYNRMYLNMIFMLQKAYEYHPIRRYYKLGPLQISIRKSYLYIELFDSYVNGYSKNSKVRLTYFIEDIDQLDETTKNVISFILCEYPASIKLRDEISKELVSFEK